jgi:hypothetical protein
MQCGLENVFIHNLAGIAVNNVEAYDAEVHNLNILWSGTASVPAYALLEGTADLTNAVHHFGLRIEACQYMMQIGTNSGALQQREIHFMGGKFEWGGVTGVTGPGITIEHAVDVAFVGTQFSVGPTTSQNYINLADTGGVSDSSGVKFIGCGFIGNSNHTGKTINSASNRVVNTQVTGCSFRGCTNPLFGSRIQQVGCGFYACYAPVADITEGIFSNAIIGATDYLAGNSNPTHILRLSTNSRASDNKFVSYSAGLQAQSPIAVMFASGASVAKDNDIAAGAATGYYFGTTGNEVKGSTGNAATAKFGGSASYQINNWYDDETTYSPTDTSGASLSLTVTNCSYTRKGKLVTLSANITYPATADGSNAQISFPFTSSAVVSLGALVTNATLGFSVSPYVAASTGNIQFINAETEASVTNANLTGKNIILTVSVQL